MQHYSVGEKCIIVKPSFNAPIPYRVEISKIIISKYGKGPFDRKQIKEILELCQSYYINEFEKIIAKESSYKFYLEVAKLHQMVTILRHSKERIEYPDEIDASYISEYRRHLKLILEQSTKVNMITGEKRDEQFIRRLTPILNDLLHLADKIYSCANHLAEDIMIEDCTDIKFDQNDWYYITRKYHYNFMFERLNEDLHSSIQNSIVDDNGPEDFRKAVKENLGIDYDKVQQVIVILYDKYGAEIENVITANKTEFLKDLSNYCEATHEDVTTFLSGLTLTRENQLPISTVVSKPNSLARTLNRPFIEWNVDGKIFYLTGFTSMWEAENSLHLNAIPWGKLPDEWSQSEGMNTYKAKKHDDHDKWLDDEVEKITTELEYKFDRSVKKLVTKHGSLILERNGAGEIDFIILSPATKKVFVVECKHLMGRYDMPNYVQDYYHFTSTDEKKSYNIKLNNKVRLIKENKQKLQEHFQRKYQDNSIDIFDYDIQGVFIINSPTFYSWNSEIRIYTVDKLKSLLQGELKNLVYKVEIAGIGYTLVFPYFKKPIVIDFDFDDDGPVDKFGYPI